MNTWQFDPRPEYMHDAANMFRAEQSPIGGYAGDSHFGYVNPAFPGANNPGWHVTTDIHGLGQGMPIRHHDFLSDMNLDIGLK